MHACNQAPGRPVTPHLVAQQVRHSPDKGTGLADSLPGWGATLMFALAPLPQLARCFADPNTLQVQPTTGPA
jgi:hypothetical protein